MKTAYINGPDTSFAQALEHVRVTIERDYPGRKVSIKDQSAHGFSFHHHREDQEAKDGNEVCRFNLHTMEKSRAVNRYLNDKVFFELLAIYRRWELREA